MECLRRNLLLNFTDDETKMPIFDINFGIFYKQKNGIDYICSFDTKDYKVKVLAEVKNLDVKKVCHKGGETFGILCTFGDYRK